ncbi:MAG TPA: hypothetical protein VHQ24_06930, partial [Lachnospiraceae bacterium]|nr:hypothetical protein [Lachnospiraceae bacterium]
AAINTGFSKLDVSNIPDNVQGMLKNPQIITNSESIKQIAQQVPEKYASFFSSALDQAKKVLANSIHEIFLFCMIAAIGGIILTLFFKDAPLRKFGGHSDKCNERDE